LDIIITGEQAKILNSLWTVRFFLSKDKTFFFKFYNNILGYNNAVAHFVQGHSPYCTFCELNMVPEQNREGPLHLFYECHSVSNIIDRLFRRITNDNDFEFSSREYFSTFERREFSHVKNKALTIIAKLTIAYIWDYRNSKYLPDDENCWQMITDKLTVLSKLDKNFL
jgi:hypothetical protein